MNKPVLASELVSTIQKFIMENGDIPIYYQGLLGPVDPEIRLGEYQGEKYIVIDEG